MKSLRGVFYIYSRCLFRERIQECGKGRRDAVTYALRCMSNTPCLKENLPKTKDSSRELEEFGKSTLKKKPELASSLADLADRSPVLQKLIDMGVEIYRFDNDWNLCKFLLSLDFEKNIKPYLAFLCEHGVEKESLAEFITDNPYILRCDLDDLQVRINYLESKGFSKAMRAQIISGNPKWLSYEVKKIDGRLGDLQKKLKLSGNEVRTIALKFPRVMNVAQEKLKLNLLMLKQQLQLTSHDVKKVLTKKPILLAKDPNDVMKTYYYLQDEMKVPVGLMIDQPEILCCKVHVLSIRHRFLVKLGRAQYNPKQPGYVSLQSLGTMNDENFCQTIAMTKVNVFHEFQKTL